jgi:NAD(P)-dependent dehydrogenase (short-subunit alcohol dehydrogenase family)
MNVKQLFDLTGRVALVTGGSRGLGLQMAEALGELGARVAITARKANELDEACAHLARAGIDARPFVADLGKTTTPEQLVDAVLGHFGRIDILVNNAGATWGAPAADHSLEAWLKVINLNLTGVFLTTQQVAKRAMIPARYGKIINISSVAAIRGTLPGDMQTVAYNTSKGGLASFGRAVAAEWGVHNITVNTIAPGFFPSKMTHGILAEIGDRVIARTPLGKLGSNDDLKGLIALFASDASRHITAQFIVADGGASSIT